MYNLWGDGEKRADIERYIQSHPAMRLAVKIYADGNNCRLEIKEFKAYNELRSKKELGLRAR